MPEPDDISLLKQYAGGDESAFAALFDRHVHLVYSAALRQARNPSHAEEVTQAVFILLARKAKSINPKTVLSGWLYQAARLTTSSLIKREIRRQRREQEVYMQSLTEPETPLWEQIAPLLDEAMGCLREQDRNAIVLRFFENRAPQEVAEALKVNEVTARKRVSRALEKLRNFFAKRGVLLTTPIIGATISGHSVQAAPPALANPATAVAIAKGAATSASTLPLVKGASIIMARTKAKTIIAGAVATLLVGGGAAFITVEIIHAVRKAFAPNIQGTWEGVVRLEDAGVRNGQEARAHVVLRLFKTNGVYRATTDWPELGEKDVPMLNVVYDYPNLVILQTVRDAWNLKVAPHATELFWNRYIHFIQPDPVALTRTTTPLTVPEPLTESDFAPGPGSALQGYWEGEIGTGTNTVPVDLKIARLADGTFRAEGDVPMQGIQGRPMIVSYQPPNVQIRPADGAGIFHGQLNYSDTEISGSWTQGGQSMPARVHRADYEAKHAHDAEKDYSFTSESDLQGHWKGAWIAPFPGKPPIRQALDIAKLPDGSYSATMASVDSFGTEAPVPTSDFEYSPPHLHMEWKWEGWAYDGTLENGKLAGTWSEGGGGFSLIFERTND